MSTKSLSPFGIKVRSILEQNRRDGRKPDSIRSLARVMGGGDIGRSEVAKRSLHKWISGKVKQPNAASVETVAAALGVSPEDLSSEDDDEDPSMRAAFLLFVDLMGQIQERQTRRREAVRS